MEEHCVEQHRLGYLDLSQAALVWQRPGFRHRPAAGAFA